VTWLLVAPLTAWTALRLMGAEWTFLLVVLAAFTPYAAVVALAATLVAAALRRWPAAALAAASAAALVVTVAPRAVRDEAPAGSTGRTLRVLTVNTNLGHASGAGVAALVRREGVDILSVQELTPAMATALDAVDLPAELPHSVLRPRLGAAGTGLYARVPLRAQAPPTGTAFAMVAARARVVGAPAVDFVAVHPPAPRRTADVAIWRHDVRSLPRATRNGPVRVLVGDFNATLDQRELRRLLDTGYRDAAAAAGAGLKPTWPSRGLMPPPVTIDHVLADGRCGVGRVRVLPVPGSDHRAVLAELMLPRPDT
jgi:endonuclease/exonuclease/phosphatase (EEP) superfamily protein YafD